MADRLGDPTPRSQKRLTLNPLRHFDPIGGLFILIAGFGWAKPVLVDMQNFKNPRRDMALVAAVGPLSNFVFALITMALFKIAHGIMLLYPSLVFLPLLQVLYFMAVINLWLMALNILPIPPLDGSKIVGAFLPERTHQSLMRYEKFGIIILLFLIFTNRIRGPIGFITAQVMRFIETLTLPIDMIFVNLHG